MKKVTTVEIISILISIIISILFIKYVNSEYKVFDNTEYMDVTKDGTLFCNGELRCIGNVSEYNLEGAKYSDKFKITVDLNKKRLKKPVVTFNNKENLAYEVKLNSKLISSYMMKSVDKGGVCSGQIRIPLKTQKAKGKLEITFKSVNDKRITNLPKIICISASKDVSNFIMSNIEYIIIGLALIEFGLLFLIFMWINIILKFVNRKLAYIGCGCISTGVWIFSYFQISSIVFNNTTLEFYMEYVAFVLTLAFIGMYVRELYEGEKERKILIIDAGLIIVSTIISIILQINNFANLKDCMMIVQLGFLPIIFFILKKYIIKLKESRNILFIKVLEIVLIVFFIGAYIILYFMKKEIYVVNFKIFMLLSLYFQATKGMVREIHDSYVISAEEKSIAKLAYMDTLTGLSNRRALEKYIHNLNNRGKDEEYTVCSFDLNRLKKINDTYGHAAGDILIKSFASELKLCVNSHDDFVGRMGGDEFIAIIKKERSEKVLNKIKENISEKNKNDEFEYKVKYSVGTSEYLTNGECDIQDCIRMADYAMYEMKSWYNK